MIIELKIWIECIAWLRPAILVSYLYVTIRYYNNVLLSFMSNSNTLFKDIVGNYLFKVKKRQQNKIILGSGDVIVDFEQVFFYVYFKAELIKKVRPKLTVDHSFSTW